MCSQSVKETAYRSLVQPVLEYSCTVWDPHLAQDIAHLEAVQRRAARFVMRDYGRTSSVTDMMTKLDWIPLSQRRKNARLTLFFKVVNGLVAIPPDNFLETKSTRTRSKHTQQYKVLSPQTEIYRNSFFPKTIIDWNNLCEEQVSALTIDIFKSSLLHSQQHQ
jgi:hypothetical protein